MTPPSRRTPRLPIAAQPDSVATAPTLDVLEPRLLLSGGQTYVVDSLADVVADDGLITLREAIEAANTNQQVHDAPAGGATDMDTIEFDPELFSSGLESVVLDGSALEITDNLEIVGPGRDLLKIDADMRSGAMVIEENATASLSGMEITRGSEHGVDCQNGSHLTMTNAIVSHSYHDYAGGGIHGDHATIILHNVSIKENHARSETGGIYLWYSDATITDCIIENNTSRSYAGIKTVRSTISIIESTFSGNSASSSCSGVHVEYSLAFIGNTLFLDNSSDNWSGAISSAYSQTYMSNTVLQGNSIASSGSLISVEDSDVFCDNLTAAGNSAPEGFFVRLWEYNDPSRFVMNNSIIYGGDMLEPVYGSWSGHNNIIGVDPGFVDTPTPGADGQWGTADDHLGDLHLASTSPAIDAGDSALLPPDICDLDGDGDTTEPLPVDFDGNNRVYGEAVDIGAYEYQSAATPGREAPSTVVTSLQDNLDPYDQAITLREALLYASRLPGADTITFSPSLSNGVIDLNEELWIERSIDIDGIEAPGLEISTTRSTRILNVAENETVSIANLSLTGGQATNGGALYAGERTRLTLSGVALNDNTAMESGGALFTLGSLTLFNCSLEDNTAGDYGGGFYAGYNAAVTIIGSALTGNTAAEGGGAFLNEGALVIIQGAEFISNGAEYGGGLMVDDGYSVRIVGTLFESNSASMHGGGANLDSTSCWVEKTVFGDNAASNYGGGLYLVSDDGGVIYTTIEANEAQIGGGLFAAGGIRVVNSSLERNTGGYGGGVYLTRNAELSMANSVLWGNTATRGGAIYNREAIANIYGSTVSFNAADEGSAIYNHPLGGATAVYNTIVAFNDGETSITGPLAGHSNLIGIDPLFVAAPSPGPDSTWGTPDDDYGDLRLRPDSPAVDAGSTSDLPEDFADLDNDGDTDEPLPVDAAGFRRVIGSQVDIGAFERPVLGDFNDDGVMNGLDIPGFKTALIDQDTWNATQDIDCHLIGDFNNDGLLNGLDIPGFKTALAGGVAAAGASMTPDGPTVAAPGTETTKRDAPTRVHQHAATSTASASADLAAWLELQRMRRRVSTGGVFSGIVAWGSDRPERSGGDDVSESAILPMSISFPSLPAIA